MYMGDEREVRNPWQQEVRWADEYRVRQILAYEQGNLQILRVLGEVWARQNIKY